jgi:hypothetical protein
MHGQSGAWVIGMSGVQLGGFEYMARLSGERWHAVHMLRHIWIFAAEAAPAAAAAVKVDTCGCPLLPSAAIFIKA